MSKSDYHKAIEETQRESSTADQPEAAPAPPADGDEPEELQREDRRRDPSRRPEDTGVPPGSSGAEDDYDSGEDR